MWVVFDKGRYSKRQFFNYLKHNHLISGLFSREKTYFVLFKTQSFNLRAFIEQGRHVKWCIINYLKHNHLICGRFLKKGGMLKDVSFIFAWRRRFRICVAKVASISSSRHGAKEEDYGSNTTRHGAEEEDDGSSTTRHGAKGEDDWSNTTSHGAKGEHDGSNTTRHGADEEDNHFHSTSFSA